MVTFMVTFMAALGERAPTAPRAHAASQTHTAPPLHTQNKTQATTLGFNLKW